MTPEEINAKALELALEHYKGDIHPSCIEHLEILKELAIIFRKFIADTSWAKKPEEAKDLIGKPLEKETASVNAVEVCDFYDIYYKKERE